MRIDLPKKYFNLKKGTKVKINGKIYTVNYPIASYGASMKLISLN